MKESDFPPDPLEIRGNYPNVSEDIFKMYPCESDGFGVPFQKLYTALREGKLDEYLYKGKNDSQTEIYGEYHGFINSVSGYSLRFALSFNPYDMYVVVHDFETDSRLQAKVSPSVPSISFHLRTKLSPEDSGVFKAGRHPDFWAGKFVKFAVHFYSAVGYGINNIFDEWYKHNSSTDIFETNYIGFVQNYIQHHDPVRAAKQTWSGQTYEKLGFNRVSHVGIDHDLTAIVARFEKHPDADTDERSDTHVVQDYFEEKFNWMLTHAPDVPSRSGFKND